MMIEGGHVGDATLTTDEKAEIVELLYRYATSLDDRDFVLFRSMWTDDCDIEYEEVGAWQGVDAFTKFMDDIHANCGWSQHRIMNPVVRVEDGVVRARSYVDAIVMVSERKAMRAIGHYDDELVPTPDGWKIARRRFVKRHMRIAPIDEAT